MKWRPVYVWVSVPLIIWLLITTVDLRYYRKASLGYDVNSITQGLLGSRQYLDRAQETYDQKLYTASIDWMTSAERDLMRVEAGAQGYNAALNHLFSRTYGNFLQLDPIVGMYSQEIRSVRQALTHNGTLKPEERAMLTEIAADLRTLEAALPESLLIRARRNELDGLVQSLSTSLKVQSVRNWLGP